MLSRAFALKLFEGFSVQRWNDFPRPVELIEMDKSGLKMVIAYLIGNLEEAAGKNVDWYKIIYGGFFELLKKIALSDIKAPIHRMIKEEYPDEFAKLNRWVVEQYVPILGDSDLLSLFSAYMIEKEDMGDLSFRILRAAHKYSTLREFQLIKGLSLNRQRIIETEIELNSDISEFLDLKGLQLLITGQPLHDFMADIEQLRFQVRWSETQRIPRTTVLGHSLFVACLTLFLSRTLNPCPKRFYNNFFCGLFHDLPEAATRDIVHPVKHATKGLPDVIKKIEDKFVRTKLIPKMDDCFRDELLYLTQDEFTNRIVHNGEIRHVSSGEINVEFNANEFNPVDGELVFLCDNIAAFLEAEQSISFGITSDRLHRGKERLLEGLINFKKIDGIDISSFIQEFS